MNTTFRKTGSIFRTATFEAMEMKIRPVEAHLQNHVNISQSAVGSDEKAPPEHRLDPLNPDVDTINFGLNLPSARFGRSKDTYTHLM